MLLRSVLVADDPLTRARVCLQCKRTQCKRTQSGGGIGAKIGNFFGSSVTNAIRDNVDTEVENYDKRRAARRNKDGTTEGECDDAADDGTARGRANGLRDDAATAASAGPMGAWLEVHGSDPLPPPSRTGETASRGWGEGDDDGRRDGSVRDQLFASSRLSGAEGRSNDRQAARWGSNATAATPPSRADESLTNGRPRPRRWGEVATAENDLDAAAALVRAQEERRLLGLDILDDPRVLHALEEAGMTLADANQLLAEQGEQVRKGRGGWAGGCVCGCVGGCVSDGSLAKVAGCAAVGWSCCCWLLLVLPCD